MKLGIKDYKISTKLILGFTSLLLVLVSTILVAYFHSKNIIRSTNLIIHTQQVITDVSDIKSSLLDLETGQRGFIITAKLDYLEPYNDNVNIIETKLSDLKSLTSDNPVQIAKITVLEKLITHKLEELNNTIQLRHTQGFESAQKLVTSDTGKVIMDKIRVQLDRITDEEIRLLDIRSVGPIEAQETTNLILIGMLIYGSISGLLIAMFTSRSITQPIKQLIIRTEEIGRGNFDHHVSIDTQDEIGRLSNSFQLMLQNLKRVMATKTEMEQEIAARKITEKQLLETKKHLQLSEFQLIESDKTKNKFLSIIAHDLRSPFSSLLILSRMLNQKLEEFTLDQQKEFIRDLTSGIENTFALLENLLLWSRTQVGHFDFNPQPENLFLIIQDTMDQMDLLVKNKSLTIHTEIPHNIIVKTDKNMFNTIFRNLLSNAIKFTPENGEISISAILKTNKKGSSYLEMKLQDNGIGMDKKTQGQLFKIGKTSSIKGTDDEKGTGLGLLICQDFIKIHKGEIWVESEIGKGSTFHLTLPKASFL